MIVKDTIIIGAGLTGLTSALFLKKKGRDFLVLEKSNKIGGTIQSKTENSFLYEIGPNTGVIGNSTVVDIFEELEGFCKLEKANNSAKKRYILKKGNWETMPMGLGSAISTPLFTLKDKFRILGEPFRKPGSNPHETLAELVKRRMGQSFLDYAIDPFIKGVYAGDTNNIIPKYALPKLYNLEQNYGSFIGGSIKKKIKEKNIKDKRVDSSVFSFKDGLISLCSGLQKFSGISNFILNAENIIINTDERGFIVSWKNKQGESQTAKAENVITTVGSYELRNILPFVDSQYIKDLDNLNYAKVTTISLGFNRWKGMNLDGFGGLIPTKENRNILGALFMSSLFSNRAPVNGELLTLFMGGMSRPDIFDMNDDEILNIVEKEVLDLMKLDKFSPDLIKIYRHKYAIPQYEVTSKERFDSVSLVEKQYPGLYIGGNLKDGIGMADRMQQGKKLTEKA